MSGLPGVFSFLRPLGVTGGTAIGFAVGHGVSPAIRPVIQDLANAAWELHQVRPLEASIAAQLVAEGLWSHAQGEAEAARTGINAERFDRLVAAGRRGPTIEAAYDALRRELIDGATFARAMHQAGIRPEWDEMMRALVEVLPPVSDAVRFAVREAYDEGASAALDLDAEYPPAFEDAAVKLGLSPRSARLYWRAHWDLPSYTQATEMLFRGEISQAEFETLLKALDYAPTWRAKLLAIARRIPTISDFIRFAQREVFDPAQRSALGLDSDYPEAFTEKAALHGMSEQDARDYWAAHWRLPSARQGYTMLWRGLISATQLDGLLKALDYPAVWRDRLAEIAHIVPGRIDLKRFLRHDILDREQVKAGYVRLGYLPDDAEYMTQVAEAEVGADADGGKWETRARGRLYTVAHDEYLDGSIDGSTAAAMLARVGALPAERVRIIALWDAEAEIARLELTPTQIRKAFRSGRYTEATALAELEERGMAPDDAATFLDSG